MHILCMIIMLFTPFMTAMNTQPVLFRDIGDNDDDNVTAHPKPFFSQPHSIRHSEADKKTREGARKDDNDDGTNPTIVTFKKNGMVITIEGTVAVLIKNNMMNVKVDKEETTPLVEKQERPARPCCNCVVL